MRKLLAVSVSLMAIGLIVWTGVHTLRQMWQDRVEHTSYLLHWLIGFALLIVVRTAHLALLSIIRKEPRLDKYRL